MKYALILLIIGETLMIPAIYIAQRIEYKKDCKRYGVETANELRKRRR